MNKRENVYELLWLIENYSYYGHMNGGRLYTPCLTLFLLENSSWILNLYPRGKDAANARYISISLARERSTDGPKEIFLNFELSLLTKDGSILKRKIGNFLFRRGTEFLCPDFLDIEEVLIRRNAECLPEDTLKVRCKIWYGEGNNHSVRKYSVRTRIEIQKISFLHKIESFSALKPNEEKTLQIRSHLETEFTHSNIYFTPEDTVIFEIVPQIRYFLSKQKIWLLDGSGKVTECCEAYYRMDAIREKSRQLPLSLTRKAILNKKEEYLPNDELSLLCECTFPTGMSSQIEEIQCDKATIAPTFSTGMSSQIEEIQCDKAIIAPMKQTFNTTVNKNCYIPKRLATSPSVLDDLGTIYRNKSLTDVEVKTKTKSFPAHKLVLCARSPVFKAMLTSDMKEKNTHIIQMDDLDDDTVQKLLVFLYSDNIGSLQWESAVKLYYAGDKYAIEKLKLLCSSFLVSNLSSSTASELLHLADTHNDCDLKNFVEDFILEHEEEVFGSDEWEKLIEVNPQLVIKTMHLKYKRKKGGK